MIDHEAYFKITSAAYQLARIRVNEVYDEAYDWKNAGTGLTSKHKEKLAKIESDYKDTILGAWDKHKLWLEENNIEYVIPNEVERLKNF